MDVPRKTVDGLVSFSWGPGDPIIYLNSEVNCCQHSAHSFGHASNDSQVIFSCFNYGLTSVRQRVDQSSHSEHIQHNLELVDATKIVIPEWVPTANDATCQLTSSKQNSSIVRLKDVDTNILPYGKDVHMEREGCLRRVMFLLKVRSLKRKVKQFRRLTSFQ
ncbi:hypothetical protein CHS0354_023073 [Potamilus streckersoni]|uniref:Uncharacterized protein n=1 Tax=Potamilus streckersoni TaxID=2493646 RepID=A0AAE0RW75_9BIVA|nr:hypothetical protein CHS0354_023073 [Potamilus streckersoni]